MLIYYAVSGIFPTITLLYLVTDNIAKQQIFYTNSVCALFCFLSSNFLNSRKIFPAVSKKEAGESELANINSSFC